MKILLTGAGGQVGLDLLRTLQDQGHDLHASDLAPPHEGERLGLPWYRLDVTSRQDVDALVAELRPEIIYHLAAILSAAGERDPLRTYAVNQEGTLGVLEAARRHHVRQVIFTSTIAVFGPGLPDLVGDDVQLRPTTMYGVTKVAGELLTDYYASRFGVDVRGLRFPGLISHSAPPGGGTTDYAVTIFYEALRHGRYTCFLGPDTRLDMMYMPDAIRATVELMEADPGRLKHRNAFNIAAVNFTPVELAAEIRKHIPGFTLDYDIDPVRQRIANSWPESLDDSAARAEWGWAPRYDLAAMVAEMLKELRIKLRIA